MNKVYLVGLPGAGKTHCGRWLAEKLGWKFEDLDHAIEKSMKQYVSSIFDAHGEEVFRQIEEEELKKTAKLSNTVISTGGGTAAFGGNMEWMQRHGLTVYINTPLERIAGRILQNAQKRPMFSGMNEPEILVKLYDISEKRGEFYSRARLIWNKEVPSDGLYVAVNKLISLYSARF